MIKNCKNCQIEKPISEFSTQKSRGKEYVNNICCSCMSQQQKEYRETNKEEKRKRDKDYYEKVKNTPEFIERNKQYLDSHKDQKKEYDKDYREINSDKIKQYNFDNKEAIAEVRHDYYIEHKEERKQYNKQWYANNKIKKHKINAKYILSRLKKDLSFRLRSNISKTVRRYLVLNNSSKNGGSTLQFLPYTIQELKEHLEKQFEPWMTWNNYGKYNTKTWNDNDQSTWTWNIDHIIPQSKLPYTSMEDDNFKKCWSLENLRSYSAKQNLIDGVRLNERY